MGWESIDCDGWSGDGSIFFSVRLDEGIPGR
jgi:hypothetical protein